MLLPRRHDARDVLQVVRGRRHEDLAQKLFLLLRVRRQARVVTGSCEFDKTSAYCNCFPRGSAARVASSRGLHLMHSRCALPLDLIIARSNIYQPLIFGSEKRYLNGIVIPLIMKEKNPCVIVFIWASSLAIPVTGILDITRPAFPLKFFRLQREFIKGSS